MAEVAVISARKGSWLTFEWLAVTENDTFAKIYLNQNVSDIIIEAEGALGGIVVTLTGWVSLEGAAFSMVDPGGTIVSLASPVFTSPVRDAPPFMRPVGTGGASTLIDVRIHMKVVK